MTFQYRLAHDRARIQAILHDNQKDVCASGDTVLRIERAVRDSPDLDLLYPFRVPVPDSDPPLVLVREVIRSPVVGTLNILVKIGEVCTERQVLFEVKPTCLHTIQFHGLCAECGQDVKENTVIDADRVNMVHDSVGITVSASEAAFLESKKSDRLRLEKRLSLILDLDQTLIHATADPNVGTWLSHQTSATDVYQFRLPNDPHEYYLRLRPYLLQFLKGVAELYELHIYTMGSRAYANQVARTIDPNGLFFKERILSRDESGSFETKSLQRLFPCDQSMVVVMDDRGDVWGWAHNLIRVHPYSYFVRTGDINAPPGSTAIPPNTGPVLAASNLRAPVILDDNDKELYILLGKLQELHARFYSARNSDIRDILPEMKKKVLDGCVIAFSSLIPKNVKEDQSDPWMLATTFGAKCTSEISLETTHLVASKMGTDKTRQAQVLDIPTVTPVWLFTSIAHWRKEPESRFLLVQSEPTKEPETEWDPPLKLSDQAIQNLDEWDLEAELAELSSQFSPAEIDSELGLETNGGDSSVEDLDLDDLGSLIDDDFELLSESGVESQLGSGGEETPTESRAGEKNQMEPGAVDENGIGNDLGFSIDAEIRLDGDDLGFSIEDLIQVGQSDNDSLQSILDKAVGMRDQPDPLLSGLDLTEIQDGSCAASEDESGSSGTDLSSMIDGTAQRAGSKRAFVSDSSSSNSGSSHPPPKRKRI